MSKNSMDMPEIRKKKPNPAKKGNRLTKSQKIQAQALVDPRNKSIAEASRKTKINKATFYKNLKLPNFCDEIERSKQKILKKLKLLGWSEEAIAEQIGEGLEAETTGQFGGDPDHKTRSIYIDKWFALKGIFLEAKSAMEQADNNGPQQHLHIHFDKMSNEELKEFIMGKLK